MDRFYELIGAPSHSPFSKSGEGIGLISEPRSQGVDKTVQPALYGGEVAREEYMFLS